MLKFVASPTASPASSRKSAPSLSRTSSPSGSPKSSGGGRRPARLRLAKLSSKHWLSSSKENLDGAANPEEAEAGPPGETRESPLGSEAPSSHCDVVLLNGDSNGLSLDCSTDSSSEPEHSLLQQRGDAGLDAIYNLYAISVSAAGTPSAAPPSSLCFGGVFCFCDAFEGKASRLCVLLSLLSAIQGSWAEATM